MSKCVCGGRGGERKEAVERRGHRSRSGEGQEMGGGIYSLRVTLGQIKEI